MNKFHSLKVLNIDVLTKESVCIKLDTASIDDGSFNFIPGQYITIKHLINNEDVRRSYSISSVPGTAIEIGVKLVKSGRMSTYLTRQLKVGDSLEVMPPMGSFTLETNPDNEKHYMAICAGSGITPILSMISSVLNNEPLSSFTLLYGNKDRSNIMFLNELLSFEKEFQSQFFIYFAFSREKTTNSIYGRIDSTNLSNLFDEHKNLKHADSYFLCGPGEMIDNIDQFLLDNDISKEKIFFERFTSGESIANEDQKKADNTQSNVIISVDGDDFNFELSSNGKSVLDAAMEAGADVPFSCKGGVCCVCKAKVIEGSVTMDQNFSLSEEEIADGFILTCQSHPTSSNLVIDFDEV
jgi:ring-1,2-phenylacetyl-CoA epoxidase subunit PaaE